MQIFQIEFMMRIKFYAYLQNQKSKHMKFSQVILFFLVVISLNAFAQDETLLTFGETLHRWKETFGKKHAVSRWLLEYKSWHLCFQPWVSWPFKRYS